MTRRTYRYDADADMLYEVGSNYFEEQPRGPAVISDSLGMHGLRNHADGRIYDGKRAFAKATRRAGCVETGNEDIVKHTRRPELIGRREIGETIKRAYEEVQSYGDQAAARARTLPENRR